MQVEAEAALHLPDLLHNIESDEHSIKFTMLPLSQTLSEDEPDIVGLRISREKGADIHDYAFTRWSRSQLLSLLGTREKWFSSVDLERQADELNARTHVLNDYNFRTIRSVDPEFPVRFVRGLVSSEYADIANTEIMDAIIAKAPADAMVLSGHSGISDRAFYVYMVVPSPITIPNTTFFAYPAAVVKNSEVGYTSLYVIPGLLVVRRKQIPAVFESKAVLKKIHRGKIDLSERFEAAFSECATVWSDMTTKMPKLAATTYLNEDDAIDTMRRVLLSSDASGELVQKCVTTYKATMRVGHTALDIVEAITEVCAEIDDRDDRYGASAIAGAVLYKLMF